MDSNSSVDEPPWRNAKRMETFQPISSTLPVRYQPACPLRSWSLPMPDIFISRTLFASRLERNSYQNFIASVDPVTIPMPNPWILQDSKNEVLYRSSSKEIYFFAEPLI
uniref:Uncharacterized protein n=1 Tax=Talaromyces marneffei PM1 TaxID=1077442 RepID=A0A093X9D1_TALMA